MKDGGRRVNVVKPCGNFYNHPAGFRLVSIGMVLVEERSGTGRAEIEDWTGFFRYTELCKAGLLKTGMSVKLNPSRINAASWVHLFNSCLGIKIDKNENASIATKYDTCTVLSIFAAFSHFAFHLISLYEIAKSHSEATLRFGLNNFDI